MNNEKKHGGGGKWKEKKKPEPIFGEELRGSTVTCSNFPSLLFSSLQFCSVPLPLPCLFFTARQKGVAAQVL